MGGFSFSDALKYLKAGNRVCRKGWNGKGMFLYLVDGSEFEVNRAPLNQFYEDGTRIKYLPHITCALLMVPACRGWLRKQIFLQMIGSWPNEAFSNSFCFTCKFFATGECWGHSRCRGWWVGC